MKKEQVPIALFRLGQVVATPNALARVSQADILVGLRRHQVGDWGDLDEEDRNENVFSVKNNLRFLSAYRSETQTKFWIITEADRSVTTILLPEDY